MKIKYVLFSALAFTVLLAGCNSQSNITTSTNTDTESATAVNAGAQAVSNDPADNAATDEQAPAVQNTNTVTSENSNTSSAVDVQATQTTTLDFSDCNKAAFEFSEQSWYSGALAAIEAAGGYISAKEVGCYAADAGVFLVFTKGDYCSFGKLYKYDINADTAALAAIEDHDRGCLGAPEKFGEQSGEKLFFQGGSGDAGCSTQMTYEYDVTSNQIELKKEIAQCQEEEPEIINF